MTVAAQNTSLGRQRHDLVLSREMIAKVLPAIHEFSAAPGWRHDPADSPSRGPTSLRLILREMIIDTGNGGVGVVLHADFEHFPRDVIDGFAPSTGQSSPRRC